MNKITLPSMVKQTLRFLRDDPYLTRLNPILAGGALRDSYANKPIKDFDIFLKHPDVTGSLRQSKFFPNQTNFTPNHFQALFKEIIQSNYIKSSLSSFDIRAHRVVSSYKGYQDDVIESVWKVTIRPRHTIAEMLIFGAMPSEITFEFIFLKIEPVEFVNKKFDIGMCKIYTDGRKITLTDAFLHDMSNQTMTVVQQGMNWAEFNRTTKHHIPRLKKKYPNFSVMYSDEVYHKFIVNRKPKC